MPVTTYAISHKDTGSILSYCVLGDQKVTDTASATLLRDRLVGDNLVISLNTTSTPSFSFLKSDLVVDEIAIGTTQTDFLQNPFAYVLSIPPSAQPGDGTVKTIESGGVRALTLNAASGTLTLTLPAGLGPPTKLVAVLEGHAPVPITLSAPASTVNIPVAGAALTTSALAVIFLGQGLQSSVGLMKAV